MADVLEDPYLGNEEIQNFTDTENNSEEDEESDYEGRLLSLIYHSYDDSKDKESKLLTYECKRNKVNRLSAVRNIIENAEPEQPESVNLQSRKKDFDWPEKNYLLINSSEDKESNFSHSTPITTKSVKQRSRLDIDSPNTQSSSKCSNFSFHQVSASNNYNSKSETQITTPKVSTSHEKREYLKKSATNDDEILLLGSVIRNQQSHLRLLVPDIKPNLLKHDIQINKILSNTSLGIKEGNCSKYNLELKKVEVDNRPTKDMKHSNSEKHSEIVKLDDSSDDESVVEVAVPAKEPPPILDLSSDEEGEVFSMGNPANEDDDDIVVVYCDERASKMDGRRLNPRTDEGSNKKRKKKSKRAKSKRKSKAAPESVNPPSWTKEMSQFYNNSWGGEHFDAAVVQRSMSNTRSQWPVLFDDIAPPRNVKRNVRCNNCNTFGHGARMCPEPPKVDVCLFCGTTGHLNSKCPTPICLRCGQPSSSYNFGCRNCSALAYSLAYCNKCNSNGHLEFECPESWRRYHSTTTTEGMGNLPETVYKPRDQQFCCNCAARGHLYEECRKSPLSGNWLKRPNNSHSECSKGSKRRKMDKKQWFRGKKDKFQRNSNNWNRY